ncbi:MAG TPA: MmcQ/YjbR family DNA-binding protein [Flavobacterium sp.]
MDIEQLQSVCNSLPCVTEDIKWQNDLCFCVGAKMFCVAGLNQLPTSVSFKVTPDEFEELAQREGFRPAPYTAKYHWVMVDDLNRMGIKEWEHYTRQSYELVKAKHSPKLKKDLGL